MDNNFNTRLEKSKVQLLNQIPFFGSLLIKIRTKVDDNLPFPAATNCHDLIIFNSKLSMQLPNREFNWIYIHEVMHVALQHENRRKNRISQLWNIACDYAIHSIMMPYSTKTNILTPPKGILYNNNFQNKTAEQIYDLLYQNAKNKEAEENINIINFTKEIEQNTNAINPDNHNYWEEQKDSLKQLAEEQQWAANLQEAVQAAKNKGDVPAGLERLIKATIKKQINWKEVLHNFVEEINSDYSFERPDNRFLEYNFILPAFCVPEETLDNILILLDTSGSIDNETLSSFLGEIEYIKTLYTNINLKIASFDTEMYEVFNFTSASNIELLNLKGGGGTNIAKCFKYIKHNNDINKVIVFTDGYLEYYSPDKINNIPMLWIITDKNNTTNLPTWGEVVHIN